MSQQIETSATSSRRGFLGAVSRVATATLGAGAVPLLAQAPLILTKERRDTMTPAQILDEAKAGNRRYLQGAPARDFLAEQKLTAVGQFPAAAVLGCIDSRGPAEVVFNLRLGDIFNARIAGAIQNSDILGSLEFATKLAGAKLVVVMGHSSCGAVKGAISGVKLGSLTGLLAKIRPAVDATVFAGERTAGNHDFVDAVARKSVQLTVADIRKQSPIMAEMEKSGIIRIVGAFHHLESGVVEFL